jgi:4-hydroxy-3-polyprenylbenzoate decarboxylase
MGFGGKMCIDGTQKTEEEIDDSYASGNNSSVDGNDIMTAFPAIKSINTKLLTLNIPCLVISVEKNRKGHVKELHQQLSQSGKIEGIKMILYVEHTVEANDLPVALWRFCNNLDPRRDSLLTEQPSTKTPGKKWACMGFDGTIKTKAHDDFQRDWPNIIVAADETIASVDKKWNELGLGAFLPSPSLKFKGQIYGEEAVVE